MNASPLIAGFCRGIAPTFDTESSLELSPLMPDINTLAEKYNVTPRTARNWRKAGVNLACPMAIAKHLSEQRRPSIRAIRASLEILKLCHKP